MSLLFLIISVVLAAGLIGFGLLLMPRRDSHWSGTAEEYFKLKDKGK